MRRRPWALILFAGLQAILPTLVVGVASGGRFFAFRVFVEIWTHSYGMSFPWILWILPILSGAAIFAMKRWSYFAYLTLVGVSLALNLGLSTQTHLPLFQLFNWMSISIAVIVCSYLFQPAVRQIYFNPRIRWWESKTRFKVALDAKIIIAAGEKEPCQILDISEGGAFIATRTTRQLPETIDLVFTLLSIDQKIRVKVVHRSIRDGEIRFGAQFQFAGSRQKKSLVKIIDSLRAMKCPTRDDLEPWWKDLTRWLKGSRV